MPDYRIFQLDDYILQSGVSLRPTKIAYQTGAEGELGKRSINAEGDGPTVHAGGQSN